MQDKRILIIDDDPLLLQLVKHTLTQAGAQVHTAASGLEGLQLFSTCQPELVVLDLMMPGLDGWEVCRRIRQTSHTPIIMLTALGQDSHVIQGLQSGADDYLTKPFKNDILVARIAALLRRAALPAAPQQQAITFQDNHLTIDLAEHRVLVRGRPVKLTVKEYRLLAYLLQHANKVLTFEQILAHVWGNAYQDQIDYVHTYISRLRQKLEEDPKKPHYFLTQHGIGYRFHSPLPPHLKPPKDR